MWPFTRATASKSYFLRPYVLGVSFESSYFLLLERPGLSLGRRAVDGGLPLELDFIRVRPEIDVQPRPTTHKLKKMFEYRPRDHLGE